MFSSKKKYQKYTTEQLKQWLIENPKNEDKNYVSSELIKRRTAELITLADTASENSSFFSIGLILALLVAASLIWFFLIRT